MKALRSHGWMNRTPTRVDGRMRILHLIVSLGVTNTEYNEHCLPVVHDRDVTICSFSRSGVTPPPEITVFEGDGTYRGFWRALGRALDHATYDVIHVHAPRTAILAVLMGIRRPGSLARTVGTVHNSFHNFRPMARALLFPIFALLPAVVVCGRSAFDSLPRPLRWLGRNKITVVQNGVDTARVVAALAERHARPPGDDFVVVWVGRIIRRKDPATALDAFARALPERSRLVFVGDGDLRGSLLGEIDRRGLRSRVDVTGLLDREEVYRVLSSADVYLSTSRGEGLPVAVMEAMACGAPAILTDIPPHREIASGVDFIPLIPVGDVDAFASELRRCAGMEPEDRAAIGERCRDLVRDRFSLEAMHRSYERVYARVMARGVRASTATPAVRSSRLR